jgi:hypothetical protein
MEPLVELYVNTLEMLTRTTITHVTLMRMAQTYVPLTHAAVVVGLTGPCALCRIAEPSRQLATTVQTVVQL